MAGLARNLLPIWLLAAPMLPARGEYEFRTEINPDGTLTVFKSQSCPVGDLVIPATIGGRTVTRIGERAFLTWAGPVCIDMTNVTIPDTVTSIGDYAFAGAGLTRVTIPDGVRTIGDFAFTGCPLEDVLFNRRRTLLVMCPPGRAGRYDIPDTVTNIVGGAFDGCFTLTGVTIPRSVITIGNSAFARCAGLTDLVLPDSVISVGASVFSACSGLAEVTVGQRVTSLGASLFLGCTALTNITIPDGLTNIGPRAFSGCTSLASVRLPSSVTVIGAGAFAGSGLTGVTIPDGVKTVDYEVFTRCLNLSRVEIGRGTTAILAAAFSGCPALVDVTIPRHVRTINGGWLKIESPFFIWLEGAFGSSGLNQVHFEGDAPGVATDSFPSTAAVMYRLPGTAGWGPTLAGRATALWVRSQPTIVDFGDRFGPSTNGFRFVVSWATNVPVVVEASANVGASWTPISTNTLTDGWVQFTDPGSRSQPSRFYRVRGQ